MRSPADSVRTSCDHLRRTDEIPSAEVAADYDGVQGMDVRLSWPEDTDGDMIPFASAVPSDNRAGLRPEAGSARTADAPAAWLPAIDAHLGELVARVARLEATGRTPSGLESRVADLADRVAILEKTIQDRMGHLDDRLEYLAIGMMPAPLPGDGQEVGPRIAQLSDQLAGLAKEVSALRRRITLKGRGDPASGPQAAEELASVIADLVVAALGGRDKPPVKGRGRLPAQPSEARR
jgi:hypothetical protein